MLDGDTSQLDLSRFNGAKNLQNFALMGATSRKSIEFLAHAPLKSFSIRNAQVYGTGQPVRAWPQSIENFAVVNTNLKPEDFQSLANHASLKTVNLFDIVMKEEELAFLLTLSDLKSAMLAVDANSQTWYLPLASLKQTNLWLDIHSDAFSKADAAQLSTFTRLERLNLDLAEHDDAIIDELCKITSLEQLTITSPVLTDVAVMKLAELPNLKELVIPLHLWPQTSKLFMDKRKQLILPHTNLSAKARTLKPAPKKAKKSAKPQDAAAK